MKKQFEGQRDDEKVLFVFRRHIIALRKGFYGLLIPFALASIPSLIWPGYLELLAVALAGFVIGLGIFFYFWIGWYFTVFIVTDQRIRQITQKSFFGTSVIDLSISKIQNVIYNIPGFTGEVFGFGTIVIQTYVGDLVLDRVPHPSKTYNKLQDAVKAATENKGHHEEIEE